VALKRESTLTRFHIATMREYMSEPNLRAPELIRSRLAGSRMGVSPCALDHVDAH